MSCFSTLLPQKKKEAVKMKDITQMKRNASRIPTFTEQKNTFDGSNYRVKGKEMSLAYHQHTRVLL